MPSYTLSQESPCQVCGRSEGMAPIERFCWACYRIITRGQSVEDRQAYFEGVIQREHKDALEERQAKILHRLQRIAWGRSIRGLAGAPIFWFRCLTCGRADSPHLGWGTCARCQHNKYTLGHPEYVAGLVRRQKLRTRNPMISGRWSRKYEECQLCHQTDRPHAARGYCTKCYAFMRPYFEHVAVKMPRRKNLP